MQSTYTMTVREHTSGFTRSEDVVVDSMVTTSPDKSFFGRVIRNHPNFGAGWRLVSFGQKGQGQTQVRERREGQPDEAEMTRTELPPVLPKRRRRRKATVSV